MLNTAERYVVMSDEGAGIIPGSGVGVYQTIHHYITGNQTEGFLYFYIIFFIFYFILYNIIFYCIYLLVIFKCKVLIVKSPMLTHFHEERGQ